MSEEHNDQGYAVRVKNRHIGLNPYKWAIYRKGMPHAVKTAASIYRTVEQCRAAGAQALRELVANIAKRKMRKKDR